MTAYVCSRSFICLCLFSSVFYFSVSTMDTTYARCLQVAIGRDKRTLVSSPMFIRKGQPHRKTTVCRG
ncbi:uncharacterized protein STEHIDRAFT_121399 [Stereum hirsutum FP-91666 SS1]|uniref:uncharacterized protein n=1 Tax=Stereum hirsutum (strain FP-91666) TaxID=721885 RepID=UPI000440E03D|nr:uncharacterized protein STEHIDRAFT_121399 [Stereum hirsutum FP-91666 SS1]EIM86456.1 hypothetical protein STEHIDRAFT_121399 [Stereum hirsutum FP-91666 SS1]